MVSYGRHRCTPLRVLVHIRSGSQELPVFQGGAAYMTYPISPPLIHNYLLSVHVLHCLALGTSNDKHEPILIEYTRSVVCTSTLQAIMPSYASPGCLMVTLTTSFWHDALSQVGSSPWRFQALISGLYHLDLSKKYELLMSPSCASWRSGPLFCTLCTKCPTDHHLACHLAWWKVLSDPKSPGAMV
ncbi:hypothetical protein BDN67DRAFT_972350 [Paxillus ammoniavirescens]|nr:hypothetical protein BDN67DRAFT_972350 [Paxillus ammoniavirescens]